MKTKTRPMTAEEAMTELRAVASNRHMFDRKHDFFVQRNRLVRALVKSQRFRHADVAKAAGISLSNLYLIVQEKGS